MRNFIKSFLKIYIYYTYQQGYHFAAIRLTIYLIISARLQPVFVYYAQKFAYYNMLLSSAQKIYYYAQYYMPTTLQLYATVHMHSLLLMTTYISIVRIQLVMLYIYAML